MIISRTPYRISFFGGGSDYPEWYKEFGGEVLSSTIDKYIYISTRPLPSFFDHNYRVSYSIVEEVKLLSQIKHKVVKNALISEEIKNKLEIHYDGDLPSRSGMGSSSSFVVGLLNNINSLKNKNIDKTKLAYQSINFEQKILKECVGSQDQIACSIGGFNYIKFLKNGSFKLKKVNNKKYKDLLNKNLILLYTGQQRTAQEIAKKFIGKLTKSKKQNILNILDILNSSKKILETRNIDDFGLLLHESWKIKKSLDKSISNSEMDNIYNKAINYGALGGKILGAGGGGFFLFYVPNEKRSFFLKKMKKFVNVSFKFSNSGSEIIYKGN